MVIIFIIVNHLRNGCFVSSDLEFWSVNHTSIYKNSELKVFKNIKLLGKISNNWPNHLLGTDVYKIPESCW